MQPLPPLDCLPFFEAAARHENFVLAAEELGRTPAAVAHRVRLLERYLGDALFTRRRKGGVILNQRGRAYLGDVQRLLADLHTTTERHRGAVQRRTLRIVSVEGHAESWLMPRVTAFKEAHPDIAINLETHYGAVEPGAYTFDLWLTCVAINPPQLHRIPDTLVQDIVFEDVLLPFCSPALLQTRGRPDAPADLLDWPLLYHLGWEADWPYWFACHGVSAPDLSRAMGFRAYRMIVQAAVKGLGVAVGSPAAIAEELARGLLVPLLDEEAAIGFRYCLLTANNARERTDVQDFRAWILEDARRWSRRGSSAHHCFLANHPDISSESPPPLSRGRWWVCAFASGCLSPSRTEEPAASPVVEDSG